MGVHKHCSSSKSNAIYLILKDVRFFFNANNFLERLYVISVMVSALWIVLIWICLIENLRNRIGWTCPSICETIMTQILLNIVDLFELWKHQIPNVLGNKFLQFLWKIDPEYYVFSAQAYYDSFQLNHWS